jgi:hypothetical protein
MTRASSCRVSNRAPAGWRTAEIQCSSPAVNKAQLFAFFSCLFWILPAEFLGNSLMTLNSLGTLKAAIRVFKNL